MTPAELRRSMSAGIAFVVLLVSGVLISFGNSPDLKEHESDASAAGKFVDHLASGHEREGLIIGAYLMVLAALAFVWFCQGLADQVSTQAAGRLVRSLGVLGASAIGAASMTSAGMAGAISFGKEPVPADGDAIRVVMDMTFPLVFVVFALAAAAIIAIVALRGAWPGWVLASGWLGVIGAVFAVIFLPMIAPMLWFLIVAIVGVTKGPAAEPAAA